VLQTVTRPLRSISRAPAAWGFAAAWGIAGTLLALRGDGGLLPYDVGQLIAVLVLSWIVLLVTAPAEAAVEPRARWRSRSQLAVAALAVVLTGADGMAFHRAGPAGLASIPLWSWLFRALLAGGQAVRLAASLANLVTYVLLPLAALLGLGARPGELGLTRGRFALRALAVWATLPTLAIVTGVAVSARRPLSVLTTLGGNVLQNGFSEEFLFRGALLTRIAALAGPAWGLVLSSLAFGLWHLGANWSEVHGDPVAAACAGICAQGGIGLGLGVIFLRTHSLLAGTIVHVLLDAR
jgi:membrane protease YdiL (CAAX protease family)